MFVSDMQVKSKNRQAYTGSKIPADSPNFVNLPGSVVQDRDDNGNMPPLHNTRDQSLEGRLALTWG